jgi:hypothetical protein
MMRSALKVPISCLTRRIAPVACSQVVASTIPRGLPLERFHLRLYVQMTNETGLRSFILHLGRSPFASADELIKEVTVWCAIDNLLVKRYSANRASGTLFTVDIL